MRTKPLRIVFLVNGNTAIPAVAIALQKSGNAIILSEGAHIERNAVASINYTIDSVNINLRKSELVVLFNEWTQSQAEATAAKLKDCGAIGIGTHTAGANGDITNFNLPGTVNLTFSGHRSTMQRTGIIPDIKAEPTIKGVIAGKDEVLARAVSYLQTGK